MKEIIVSKNSKIKTIADALIFAKSQKIGRIFVENGEYYEKIKIFQDNIEIIGEDKNKTIITFNDHANKIHADGLEYNTFRTYTLMAAGKGISLRNLTVKNSAGAGVDVGQAVALSANGTDFYAENCIFDAHQDTLFCSPLPLDLQERYIGFLPDDERVLETQNYQVYNKCTIIGDIDFIFGGAESAFYQCDIISRKCDSMGFVAAPSTEKHFAKGMLFLECSFIAQENTAAYLARPWREYAKADFVSCFLGEHIENGGFSEWENTDRHLNSRFCCYECFGQNGAFVAECEWAKKPNISEIEASKQRLFGFINARSKA